MPRQTYCVVRGFDATSLAFFVGWLVGWLVGWYCPSSFACLSLVFFRPSFLPSFLGRKAFFPLVFVRRSSFVSSSLVDLRSFERWL
jgi:hypothetical protein